MLIAWNRACVTIVVVGQNIPRGNTLGVFVMNMNVRVNVRNGVCEKSIITFRRLGALRI